VVFFIQNCLAWPYTPETKSLVILQNCIYGVTVLILIKPALEVCPLWLFHVYLIWTSQTTYDYARSLRVSNQRHAPRANEDTESRRFRRSCGKSTSNQPPVPINLRSLNPHESDGGIINSNTTDSNSSEGEMI